MIVGKDARPLALWGLVSANVFVERSTPDFYLGLTPFFEPFIQDNDGKLLDLSVLKEYAARELKLPLTDDISELFIARMESVGWLQVLANDSGSKIYRCKFSGSTIDARHYAEVNERLSGLVRGFRSYISDSEVASLKDETSEEIEEHFLSFLSRRAMSDFSEVSESVEATQIEYWIAKYISWLNLHDRPTFEFVRQISGIALLAEALIEIRNPSESVEQAKGLVVFLDGPLLMNHLGLSGKRAKDNASYIVEKLRQAGATIACFRHSCDEARDNLGAVLARAPYERTGPTAEAIRNGEVHEAFLASIKNNVEHFAKNLGQVQVMPLKPGQFKSVEKYCDSALQMRLALSMPAQGDLARERDANSITIIMRRRQGHETTDFCASKFVLITSNEMLVRRANEVLRQYKALSSDRAIIGPAIHHRLVGGILFANFGLSEKIEISRRQLLAACARVVMVRPKVLERLRHQIALLGHPEESAVVDALLSQPRATEILMDYTVGSRRSISPSNVEELISAIKRTSAEEYRIGYEKAIQKEREAASYQIEVQTRELATALKEERERLVGEREDRNRERGSTSERIVFLEGKLAALAKAEADREAERAAEFERALTSATLTAEAALRRAARQEKLALAACFVFFAIVFLCPVLFSANILAIVAGVVCAVMSAVATLFFVWNRPVIAINRFFERRASASVRTELTRVRMDYLYEYMKFDYKSCKVSLVTADIEKENRNCS